MPDITQSTISNEAISNEEVLTDDVAEGFAESITESDIQVEGMDPVEFANLIAELASVYLPPGADAMMFKARYVGTVAPLLKFGGFEELTAGASLGDLVKNNPWIGAIICSGACILGLWVCWPKPPKAPKQPKEPEQVASDVVPFAYQYDEREGDQ